jgi:glucose/arabinose dehydrogenase
MSLACPAPEVAMKFNRISAGFAAMTMLVAAPAVAAQHGQPVHPAKPTTAKAPAKPTTTTAPTTTTTTAPTTKTTTTSPIAVKIASHPQLAAKVTALLPKGMTLDEASTGFKNQGQFIAALHVSKNLNIPFADLKSEMTGKDHDSLGQAIHQLRPTTDATSAAKHAESEAAEDSKIHQ